MSPSVGPVTAGDLVETLDRLVELYRSDKRGVPELGAVLAAWRAGGSLSFDLSTFADSMGTTAARLERRLLRLAPLGVVYYPPTASTPAMLDLTSHARAGARAEASAFAAASASANAAARARCSGSVLDSSSSSLLYVVRERPRSCGIQPIPVKERQTWLEAATEVLALCGFQGELSDRVLNRAAVGIYSASDYLGSWAAFERVLNAALQVPVTRKWSGWAALIRRDALEYLTRDTFLTLSAPPPSANLSEVVPPPGLSRGSAEQGSNPSDPNSAPSWETLDEVRQTLKSRAMPAEEVEVVSEFLGRVAASLGFDVLDAWFQNIRYHYSNEILVLQCPGEFSFNWVKNNYLELLEQIASSTPCRLELIP
jgi:hypothetical protein